MRIYRFLGEMAVHTSLMLKKRKKLVSMTAVFFLFHAFVMAQSRNSGQDQVLYAVKKAYPASVRLWGFDVEKNERNSAQFSGVVVTKDGIILTAAHTVMPGQTYKVFFPDGKVFIAKALGRIDLEVSPGIPDAGMLQIMEKGSFPFAEMGNSFSLDTGTSCVSISYPEKLNQELPTVRFGQIADAHQKYGFLQSTCKMEPGDSGGPLFNLEGEVIGIHSAIDVDEKMNFEIPIDIYRKYWNALHQEKNYKVYPDSDTVARIEPAKRDFTVMVKPSTKVLKMAANTFALQTFINGIKTTAPVTLINYKDKRGKKHQLMIAKSSLIGDSLTLAKDLTNKIKVISRDVEQDLVLLKASKKLKGGFPLRPDKETKPEIGTFIFSLFGAGRYERSVVGGADVNLPKASNIPYLGISVLFRSKPAAVSVVRPGSPAAMLGIKSGDLILAINGIPLHQASDFTPVLSKFWSGDEVKLEWSNEGHRNEKMVKLVDRAFVPSNHPVDRFAGGSSVRRDGFNQVFVHDGTVLPAQCGTPIVGLDGRLLGINVARFSRAVTLGTPISLILRFLDKATTF